MTTIAAPRRRRTESGPEERALRLAGLRVRRLPPAYRRVGVGARAAARRLGAVQRAQPIERGAAHAGVRGLQATPNEAPLPVLVEGVGCIEEPVDQRVAMARLEPRGGAQQVVESLRIGSQRTSRRPAAQRRLERGAVLTERVLVDRVDAAGKDSVRSSSWSSLSRPLSSIPAISLAVTRSQRR